MANSPISRWLLTIVFFFIAFFYVISAEAQVTLSASTPSTNAPNVLTSSSISLDFDKDINLSTVHNGTTASNAVYDDNITIFGNLSGQREGVFSVGADNSIIIFDPAVDFKAGEKITVVVTNNVLGTGAEIAVPISFSFIAASGPFQGRFKENTSAGIIGIEYGNSDWGDYDGDGDLDLVLVGFDPVFNQIAVIYNNVNGVFTDISAGLTGLSDSGCKWGDYDGDGDLDLVIAGLDASFTNRVANIYRNDAGVFTDIGAGLVGVDFAALDWGDYDNDGDLDLVVAGRFAFSPDFHSTTIYENNGGVFTDIGAILVGVADGSADWGDYDGDGDLDLLLTGRDESSTQYFTIYRNDDGSFVDTGASLPGFDYSGADWGDYDNDGDLDIAVLGSSSGVSGAFIYRNDAGTFIDIIAGLPDDIAEGSIQWGDYDGDGDLDLVLTGQDYSPGDNITTAIFRNDAGIFTDINAGLTGVTFQSVGNWGDYDGDGDLDLFVAGESIPGDIISKLYENREPPFLLTSSLPVANTTNVLNTSNISLDFALDIDLSSVHNGTTAASAVYDDNITIIGNLSGQIEGVYSVGADNSIIIFDPSTDLKAGEKVTVVVTRNVLGNGGEDAAPTSFSFIAASGSFEGAFLEKPSTGLIGVTNGGADWGDYDNDGDLDLIIHGWDAPSYNETAKIYDNNNGVFTDIGSLLTGVYYSDAKWGDYDNDGDLDLIVAGADALGVLTATIYRNDGGNVFTDIGAGLTGVDYAAVDWGDYDNDGDLDLVIAGRVDTGSGLSSSTIYRNDGAGSFVDISAGLVGLSVGSADWGDYDNDGDLDLLVTGFDIGSARYAIVYRNDGSDTFVDGSAGLPGVGFSAADWGDYDNDGDLDLVIMGGQSSGTNDGVYIYQNTAGTFANINAGFSDSFEDGSARWGDFDGDGDLDLLITGQDYEVGDYVTRIYINDTGTFNLLTVELKGVAEQSTGSWGDFDGDGDLDLLITGYNNNISNPSAILYENSVPPFITTWVTADGQITIPTDGSGFDYNIIWTNLDNPGVGDGAIGGVTGSYTIFGLSSDRYQVKIWGSFPHIYFNNVFGNKTKIKSIDQWGGNSWTDFSYAFAGCNQMEVKAADAPDLSGVTSLLHMFRGVNNVNAFTTADFSGWNTSNIEDMSFLFSNAYTFNLNVNSWDVSSVTNMDNLFNGTAAFNQPLDNWDVSAVTNMESMFYESGFNQPIDNWVVSAVNTFFLMFGSNSTFNQPLNSWDVGSATNLSYMFDYADAFNQPLNNWNVSNVTDMSAMFEGAAAFNQSLEVWDIASVTDMSFMLDDSGLSTENYDLSLIGWATLDVGETIIPTSVPLGAFNLNYCDSESQRTILMSTYSWTITGDVKLCDYIVTNANDSGIGSLRNKINNANSSAGETITFNIPGSGPWVISPTTPLPTITTVGTIIDASTQPSWSSTNLINIEGSAISTNNGLIISADNCEVYGLEITGFSSGDAIRVTTGISGGIIGDATRGNVLGGNNNGVRVQGDNIIIQGNKIGTDNTGMTAAPNMGHGITITGNSNQIGGSGTDEGNVISGNSLYGISMSGSVDNIIFGNKIGTDITGNLGVPNSIGINATDLSNNNIGGNHIIGGSNAGEGNIISGNTGSAIRFLSVTNNVIKGNRIGVASNGSAMGNSVGISISTFGGGVSGNDVIGGMLPGEGNIIANNGLATVAAVRGGIYIESPSIASGLPISEGNTLRGNEMYCNALKGITLVNAANNEIKPPTIESVTTNEVSGSCSTCTAGDIIDVYLDNSSCSPVQGDEYLGTVIYSSDPWTLNGLSLTIGDRITTLVTDASGNTSEYFPAVPEINVYQGVDNSGVVILDAQNTIDFLSTPLGSDIDFVFAIENTGFENLNISSIASDGSVFTIISAPVSPLAPYGTDNFTVRLNSSTAGTFSETITLINDDSDEGTFTFIVTGQVIAPEIAVYDGSDNTGVPVLDGQVSSVNFGSSVQGNDIVKTFAIENIGTNTLNISTIGVTGADFIVSSTISNVGIGTTVTFTISLLSSTVGNFNSTVTITNDDPNKAIFNFPISGSITATPEPEINVFRGPDNTGLAINSGQALAIDLGKVNQGNDIVQTFAITNTGSAILNIGTISSSSTDFSIINTISTVSVGVTEVFTISLSGVNIGSYNSTITIANNDSNENPFVFPIRGEIQGVKIFDGQNNSGSVILSNQAVNMGTTTLNVSLDKTFAIENLSTTDDLIINSITVDNPAFEVLSFTSSVPPLGLILFTIRLNSVNVGTNSTNVLVTTSINDFSFVVSGEVLNNDDISLGIYNVVTPNGDGIHDFFKIENLQLYPDNKLIIYNRWGDKVFEQESYNNVEKAFVGVSNVGGGGELITGSYFYSIDKGDGSKVETGYLFIKR